MVSTAPVILHYFNEGGCSESTCYIISKFYIKPRICNGFLWMVGQPMRRCGVFRLRAHAAV